jgi:3'(2'), 5'-bisphosphate nucleotidase
MDHLPGLLDAVARLASTAGEAILAARRGGLVIETKGDSSPVTAADRLSEGIITEGLRVLTPDWPVVAEEAASEGILPDPAERFWLVDPLDGTREFAAGRDEFCTCIALIERGRPVLGVVGEPVAGALYLGLPGVGAWREADGARRAIAGRAPPPEGLTLLDSRSHRDEAATEGFCRSLRAQGHAVAGIRPVGSALKYVRLAEGLGDVSPRLSAGMMEWDVAAGQAVLEGAGGAILDPHGQPMRYGKPGYRQGGFVAWAAAPRTQLHAAADVPV